MSQEPAVSTKFPRDNSSDLKDRRAIVVGAGVAGLSVAHYLRKRGVSVEIIERETVVGGLSRSTIKDDKYIVEMGPTYFCSAQAPISALAREISIDSLIVGDSALSRRSCIVRGGETHFFPTKRYSILKNPLLSFPGRLRLLRERLSMSGPRESDTVESFSTRRLGREAFEAIVEPVVSWATAGDPSTLELTSAAPWMVDAAEGRGGLLKGVMGRIASPHGQGLCSFKWGMGTLTARLEELLRNCIHTGRSCTAIARRGDGRLVVELDGGAIMLDADAVIVATPSYEAAQALSLLDGRFYSHLASIPYAPLAVAHIAFAHGSVPKSTDAASFLVPRSEGVRMLGSIWSSAIFPGRCPAGEDLVTAVLGGARDPAIVERDDEFIISEALAGLASVMGIIAKPRFAFVRRIKMAMPQYVMGHAKSIDEIRNLADAQQGLYITGSYFAGTSVSDTIGHARDTAGRTLAYLRSLSSQ